MSHRSWTVFACVAAVLVTVAGDLQAADKEAPKPQYEYGDFKVPAARGDEPLASQLDVGKAAAYLEQGNTAWNGARGCVSCHTNGTYMIVRPALTAQLGKPAEESRTFFVNTLKKLLEVDREELKKSTKPAQVIYTAAGLAEWDAQVTGQLSGETRQALALMFEIQDDAGTWGTLDCWPPYESDAFHEATVAAMAAAAAPGWLTSLSQSPAEAPLLAKVQKLKNYLRTTPPPHDYGRTLLLWTATRMPDLLTADQKQSLVEMLWKHQREDGGWSIRTFAKPEAWGKGNRAAKLKQEPDFETPASDGHQTGLAIIVLRQSGVAANDPRLQKGVQWLLKNQRESGRWWTRSLNTDSWHFITYSGTAFPLLALSLCDALPKTTAAAPVSAPSGSQIPAASRESGQP